VIEVCRTGPCWLLGAEDIVKYMEKKLNIKEGQTTADGMFTLKAVECLASCGTAPMMQVGQKYHECLTIDKIDTILDDYRNTTSEPISHWAKNEIK
jgi:NADH-quinone oxidoreductase subunit E